MLIVQSQSIVQLLQYGTSCLVGSEIQRLIFRPSLVPVAFSGEHASDHYHHGVIGSVLAQKNDRKVLGDKAKVIRRHSTLRPNSTNRF